MVNVVLLLGSNDDKASAVVDKAINIIRETIGEVTKVSKAYISEPYGFSNANCFVNRAIEATTTLDAYELLRRINLIEALLGRDREEEVRIRTARGEQYASRPIDIDIVFYGDETFNDAKLTIPYHFLDEREYALRPVVDVAPERMHPALRLTPKAMLEALTKSK